VEQVIREIPEADFEQAEENFEHGVVVIGSPPYLPQVRAHLVEVGLLELEPESDRTERGEGLTLLHTNPGSNLGWRIVLAYCDRALARNCVLAASEKDLPLADVIPQGTKQDILREATEYAAQRTEAANDQSGVPVRTSRILLTSYEGSKGLSAQHVILIGLHDGDLPRKPEDIRDLEICKFLVGLTRTKKKCTIIATRRFGQTPKILSTFVGWIRANRLRHIEVNAQYWQ
jgi:hypothetical protein